MSAPPTHPSCERGDGTECEPCNELTKIEVQLVQLEELYELHRQARVKRNYIHSPLIHQFPLEIVTFIFILSFPPRNECPWCSVSSEQSSPLVLTKVCHTWRALALSIPRLWSCITVDVEEPNLPLLNHQIAYSGLVPLSVHLSASDSGYPKESLASAKQAISLVMKQLHNIASLYLLFTEGVAMAWSSTFELHNPKTAPLLEELHFHCLDDGPSSSFQLKLAIEPPRLQRVRFETISFDQICIDWTSVSRLELGPSRIQMLPLALKNLKLLSLNYTDWDLLTEQTPIIHQSIQHVTADEDSNIIEFMLTMTLPSLRTLAIPLTEIQSSRSLSPIACDFLHRSLCPLQALSVSIVYEEDGERMIQALLDILQIVTGLQQLDFILCSTFSNKIPTSILEPFVRQFSSRNRGFLPCLQTLSLNIPFIPPIDLLLDAMAPNTPPSEIPNVSDEGRPLDTLHLELPIEVRPIQKDDLVRILQTRAAGKNISIIAGRWKEGDRDLVEHWKSLYGFQED